MLTLVGAFSEITNLQMKLFEALIGLVCLPSEQIAGVCVWCGGGVQLMVSHRISPARLHNTVQLIGQKAELSSWVREISHCPEISEKAFEISKYIDMKYSRESKCFFNLFRVDMKSKACPQIS